MIRKLPFRPLLAAIAALFLTLSPVAAQEPPASHMTAARDYIEAKGAAAAFEGAIPALIDQVRGNFLQTNPDLGKQLGEVSTALKAEFATRRAELVTLLARAYSTRFTEAELKEATAFLRSPVGRKLVTDEPAVLEDAFTRMQAWSNKLADDVIVRMRAEMKKRGFTL
jgi:uncharacterized protein